MAKQTIIVMSDSHGDRAIVEEIRNHYIGKVDAIFHNGDSELPSDDEVWQGIQVVAGNMAEDSSLIISTHQVHDVEQLLDHIIILDNSQVIVNASTEDITNDYTFGIRQPNEMDDSVLYAEPSIQGNNVIARRQKGDNETTINLELLFNAATTGKLK